MNLQCKSRLFAAMAAFWAASVACAQPPDAAWNFDVVHLKTGIDFHGLILEENQSQLSFLCIRRQPGRATVFLPTTFAHREVARIERLTKQDRDLLTRRVELLRGEAESRETRLHQLELKTIDWPGRPGGGLEYQSEWFVFKSNAPEEVVRRASVRLEEAFAAFGRFLKAGNTSGNITTILLFRSREEYRHLLRAENRHFENTAFYDRADHRIVCASDLERLGEDLALVRKDHLQIRADLDRRESALVKLYKGMELLRHIQPIRETRSRLDQADRQNETAFAKTTRNLFATLTHESFHAYVDAAADFPEGATLPRWLNEGLAQVFESAIVEAGELRLGHADPIRLTRIKELVRRRELPAIGQLLKCQTEHFLTNHGLPTVTAERHYLAAWGLAMYLTFERRLIDDPAFREYLKAVARRSDALSTFAAWVGDDVAEFEREWRQYLLRLQPDGTLAALTEGKQ